MLRVVFLSLEYLFGFLVILSIFCIEVFKEGGGGGKRSNEIVVL